MVLKIPPAKFVQTYENSDNIRNAHSATIGTTALVYTKLKTITLSERLKGSIKIKYDYSYNNPSVGIAYFIVKKNGSDYGTEQNRSGNTAWISQYSETFLVIDLPIGTTLELWVKSGEATSTASVRNFNICYDLKTAITVVNS